MCTTMDIDTSCEGDVECVHLPLFATQFCVCLCWASSGGRTIESLTSTIDVCATHTASTCARPIFYLHAYNRGLVCQVSRAVAAAAGCVCHRGEVLGVSFLASRGAIKFFFFANTLGRICRSLFSTSSGWKANIDVFVGAPNVGLLSRPHFAQCKGLLADEVTL